ncbi:MAG: DEAD/DEAH box helicase [Ignavibacteriaceae bacterium]
MESKSSSNVVIREKKHSQNVSLTAKKVFTIKGTELKGESPIKYDERINERKDIFDIIFTDGNDYNILARMGGGKTTGIIDYIYKQGLRGVITVPLKLNAEQIAEYFLSHYQFKIGFVHGDVKDEQIQTYLNDPDIKVIACVYDSLAKLTNFEGFKPQECILIIDEIHNLSVQYMFRYQAIKQLNLSKHSYKKRISLTGTPEGTLYNDALNVIFEPQSKTSSPQKKVKLVILGSSSIDKFAKTVLRFNMKGKCVIFVNDKDKIDHLARYIKSHIKSKTTNKNFSAVETLYSVTDKKSKKKFNKKLFDYLVRNGEIPNEVEYLITSSIFSDGVNIMNSDIDKVLIFDVHDWWVKRQYIARFRKGIGEVVDFSVLKKTEYCKWFNLKQEYANRSELFNKHLVEMEKLKEARFEFGKTIGLPNIKMIPLPEKNDFIFYDDETRNFVFSRERVALSVIEDLNQIMYKDYNKALEFCKDIAGYDVEHISFKMLYSREESEKKISAKLTVQEKEYFRDEFKKFFKLYTYENSKENNLTQYIQGDYFPSEEFDEQHFKKINEKYFLNLSTRNLLRKIFDLSMLQYPFCVADKVVELSFNNKEIIARKMILEIYYEAIYRLQNTMVDKKVRPETFELFKKKSKAFKLMDIIVSNTDYLVKHVNYKRISEIIASEYTKQEIKSALNGMFTFKTKNQNKKGLWELNDESDLDAILDRYGIDSNRYGNKILNTNMIIVKKELDALINDKGKHRYSGIVQFDLKALVNDNKTKIENYIQ